jgi:hypothetical protein
MDGQHLLVVNLRKGGNKKEQWAKHIPIFLVIHPNVEDEIHLKG